MESMIITEENIELLARKVIEIIEEKNKNEAFVILLEGDLGAGKTTFVKSFGKCLSIEEDILSPTFILKKGYDAVHHKIKKIIHVSDLHIRTFQLHDMYKRQFKLFIDE